MERQLHETVGVEAAYVERGIGKHDTSPGNEKEKSHKHRGIFHLHHHSKDEKEEDKKKDGSKREKIAAAMVGLGATLAKIKHKSSGGGGKGGQGGGAEEQEEGEEGEEEEEEEDEGDDGGDEEEGGKFSAFITMIAEAFEE
ncbi:unnamed protein product [Microthlaspi erraticum]|uniref:Uncharacterized protein n=1 Tax=Microthlaspi erraticum TaxID=1685480 RepID=A0A6D2ICK6_9BRAS|nr:unnamed protein product [Microthlaspi erraticum]